MVTQPRPPEAWPCTAAAPIGLMALLLLLGLAPSAALELPASRYMNGSNFGGHNLKGQGCAPVVTSKHTTPITCQAACDALASCDMWTWVGAEHKVAPTDAPPPWCCLKSCGTAGGGCPPPNAEVGCVSGAKDPAKYNKPQPPPPPPARAFTSNPTIACDFWVILRDCLWLQPVLVRTASASSLTGAPAGRFFPSFFCDFQ